jgi:hypothetical protein
MNPMTRLLLSGTGALVGAAVGLALGCFIPFLICLGHDRLVRPSAGSGWLTIGWIFCFVTAPLGALVTAVFSAQYLWLATS